MQVMLKIGLYAGELRNVRALNARAMIVRGEAVDLEALAVARVIDVAKVVAPSLDAITMEGAPPRIGRKRRRY